MRVTNKPFHRHALSLAVAGLMFTTTPQLSLAQALEEIIVTAQKREENIQETPISMNALSTTMLENKGITNAQDLITSMPGVGGFEAIGSRGNISVNIRGVSTGNPSSPSIDPANAFYIDGVYIGKAAGSALDVAELERVEILRGPQGTLYGRNSTGGAINFITKKPTGELHVKATATVGNYDLKGYKVSLDLPALGTEGQGLGTLATSFAIQGRDRDPLYDNTNPNLEGFESLDRSGYRFAARWQPSDTVTVDYAFDHSELDENATLANPVGITPLGAAVLTAPGYPYAVESRSTSRGDALTALRGGLSLPDNILGMLGFNASNIAAARQLTTWIDNYIGFQNDVLSRGTGRPNRGSSDTNSTSSNDGDGHTLTLAWEAGELGALGDVEFKSITAYREVKNVNDGDIDGVDNTNIIPDLVLLTAGGLMFDTISPALPGAIERTAGTAIVNDILAAGGGTLFYNRAEIDYEQFSQELQMNGSTERLDYTIGLYYFEDESEFRNYRAPLFPIAFSESSSYDNSTKAHAIFGQATWRPPVLDDRLSLTAGLRYTEEEKDVTYLWRSGLQGAAIFGPVFMGGTPGDNYTAPGAAESQPPVAGIYGRKFKENFHNLSGKFTAAYQATDDINVFFTYSTGYRSGGFNGDFFDTINDTANTFDEEVMEQYEIGLKSDWWDKRLRINAALYSYTYDDLQVSLILPQASGSVTSALVNGGSAKRWGAELEVQVAPIEDLLITASYNYLYGDFDEYSDTCTPDGSSCLTNADHYAYRGQSPSNQVQLGVDYVLARWDVASLKLNLEANWASAVPSIAQLAAVYDTNGDRVLDTPVFYEAETNDERTIVNGRVTLDDMKVAGGTLRMGLWAKNLFDQDYRNFTVNFGNSIGVAVAQYGEPRTYGLDVTWEY